MGGASTQSLLCCRLSAQHDVILTRAKERVWLAEITLAHEYRATKYETVKTVLQEFYSG